MATSPDRQKIPDAQVPPHAHNRHQRRRARSKRRNEARQTGTGNASADDPDPESIGDQLLYSRKQAARLLGDVSISFMQRLERKGKLTPIKLIGSRGGTTFYRAQDLRALVANLG